MIIIISHLPTAYLVTRLCLIRKQNISRVCVLLHIFQWYTESQNILNINMKTKHDQDPCIISHLSAVYWVTRLFWILIWEPNINKLGFSHFPAICWPTRLFRISIWKLNTNKACVALFYIFQHYIYLRDYFEFEYEN